MFVGAVCLNTAQAQTDSVQTLFDQKQWQQVVDAVQSAGHLSADLDYYYGVSLAQLGRWDLAQDTLLAAQRRFPDDPRFSIELGGIAFQQKQYPQSAKWLRRGLQRSPLGDPYATDFLATVYFLQGNLDAALKYWNRIDKPRVQNVKLQDSLRTDPLLLDRAFTFAPGATLGLSDLLTTRSRLHGLGVFSAPTLRLEPRDDGRFDAIFLAQEKNGFGTGKLSALLSTLSGVGFQTVYPEYFNLNSSAINATALLRWDPRKRRATASLSGPWKQNPKRRYWLNMDLQDEAWQLPDSSPTSFGLRRNAASAGISSFRAKGWSWSILTEFSHRDYGNPSGTGLPEAARLTGYQLKQSVQLNRELWRIPERRIESSLSFTSDTATIWTAPAHTFQKLQTSLSALWFPQSQGDDYATQLKLRFGKTFGQAPFDEWFILGLERDNDLWMRAHIGTANGRKGSAPLGRQYFLSNWEIDKNLYGNGLLRIKLSPFLDIGRTDAALGLGSTKWLWDTGVQAKVSILGVGIVFVYGKDLRTGKNAFYVHAAR